MSLQPITEIEVWRLAGDAECPVLFKEESEPMEAAVCLKRFPNGYIVGASDRSVELRMWWTDDYAAAEARYNELVLVMRQHGTPLFREIL